jgi:hypothetical protein
LLRAIPMKPSLFWLTVVVVLFAIPTLQVLAEENDQFKNELPAEVVRAIEDGKISLWSLGRPMLKGFLDTPKFDDYPVLGRLELAGDDRERVVNAVRDAIPPKLGVAFGCFNPRHNLRVEHDGATYDLLLCFECLNADIYKNGKKIDGIVLSGKMRDASQKVLNDVLTAAKIELPPPAKK